MVASELPGIIGRKAIQSFKQTDSSPANAVVEGSPGSILALHPHARRLKSVSSRSAGPVTLQAEFARLMEVIMPWLALFDNKAGLFIGGEVVYRRLKGAKAVCIRMWASTRWGQCREEIGCRGAQSGSVQSAAPYGAGGRYGGCHIDDPYQNPKIRVAWI